MKKSISVNVVKGEDGKFKVNIEALNLTAEDAFYLLDGLDKYSIDSNITYDAPVIPELEVYRKYIEEFNEVLQDRLDQIDNQEVELLTLEEIVGAIRSVPDLAGKEIKIHPDFLDDLNKINKKPSN